jgi:hypothetical protein
MHILKTTNIVDKRRKLGLWKEKGGGGKSREGECTQSTLYAFMALWNVIMKYLTLYN